VQFLHDRVNLPPRLEDSEWLLDRVFLTYLFAELNQLNTELKGEKKTIIKMTGTIDSFKEKLKLWKTQVITCVPTHYPSVQNCAEGALDAFIYILCIDKPLRTLKEYLKSSSA
jgi:hypothetical protein